MEFDSIITNIPLMTHTNIKHKSISTLTYSHHKYYQRKLFFYSVHKQNSHSSICIYYFSSLFILVYMKNSFIFCLTISVTLSKVTKTQRTQKKKDSQSQNVVLSIQIQHKRKKNCEFQWKNNCQQINLMTRECLFCLSCANTKFDIHFNVAHQSQSMKRTTKAMFFFYSCSSQLEKYLLFHSNVNSEFNEQQQQHSYIPKISRDFIRFQNQSTNLKRHPI